MHRLKSYVRRMELKRIWLIMIAFSVACTIWAAITGEGVANAVMAIVLVTVPMLAEVVLNIHIHRNIKLAFMFFGIAAQLLGHIFMLYYIVPHWDKLLHTYCGVFMGAFGFGLPGLLESEHPHRRRLQCACGLMFTLAASALWELYEFTSDFLTGGDLQNDHIVSSLHSLILGDGMGSLGGFDEITSVVVNGVELPGYLDVGLYDTMLDIVVCTLGAIVFCIIVACCKKTIPPLLEHCRWAKLSDEKGDNRPGTKK